MKVYIISIIGATILSALAGILSPEKWRGFVKLVTALVVISSIMSPAMKLIHADFFSGFEESFTESVSGAEVQTEIIKRELCARVNSDIEERLKKEFNISVRAECDISVNDEGKIDGVNAIRIYGAKLSERARLRLYEVYGTLPGGVHDE